MTGLTRILANVRVHLHEMMVRRSYSDSELLGHFCTELRRQTGYRGGKRHMSLVDLWDAPFKPRDTFVWGGVEMQIDGEMVKVTREQMEHACKQVELVSDEELALGRELARLSVMVPQLQQQAAISERLTRQMQDLSIHVSVAQEEAHG